MSPIWNPAFRLVLASGSVTRQRLLQAAGLPVEAIPANVDERAIEAGQSEGDARELALTLAKAKALSVAQSEPGALVVGADQVLSLESLVFHKSTTRDAGLRTLATLAGKTHRLTSAFALARDGHLMAADADAAEMTMRELDETALRLYFDTAGPGVLGSVGVYQWEGVGVHLFSRVAGDHSTILGLPMLKLLAALRAIGALRI
ncbi:MAG: Maf family protein [Pseudomonadota bacterium]|nr:Maf family protein [Pseudomonadota bacterium]